LKIAVLSTSYPAFPGDGCGHFVETEARLLAAEHDVIVVTAAHEGAAAHAARREAERERVARLPGGGAFGWPGVAARVRADPTRALAALAWARQARRLLLKETPLDRVVAHWAFPCGWPIGTGVGAELHLVSHGADVRFLVGLPLGVRRIVMERLLERAASWRFVSGALLEQLLASVSRSQAKRVTGIAYIEAPALTMPDVCARSAEIRRDHGGPRLAVCVGRLVPTKRVDRVIDHVAQRAAPPTRLVVVGDGPMRRALEAHARAARVDTRFVGLTTREEALAWIGAADFVVSGSEAEGLSTVEREAAALKVPFVRAEVCVPRDMR
jgi:teichuronic acid biosynthesis glycosyltransferase TuaC